MFTWCWMISAGLAAPGARSMKRAPIETAIIQDLLEGQYNSPVRVIAFNTAEGWSRDVSEEIADELASAFAQADEDVPSGLKDFVDRHGSGRPEQLPLPLRGAA